MKTIVVGLQYGDEGKARIVDELSSKFDLVSRFNGANNAGHTVYHGDKKLVLHLVPCGIFSNKECFIGNGVFVNPEFLKKELQYIKDNGFNPNLVKVSENAHVIYPLHIELDIQRENLFKIGTTKKGVGPAVEDKVARRGTRIKDLVKDPNFEWLKSHVVSSTYLQDKDNILFEGAQSSLLDIDHGDYPFVTSTNCVSMQAGIGCAINLLNQPIDVIGVFKAYTTKVGEGPYPTCIEETDPSIAALIRDKGKEYGATTGRPRKIGWLDLDSLKEVIKLNGVTTLCMNKADVLNNLTSFVKVKCNNEYVLFEPWTTLKDNNFNTFLTFIEHKLEMKIKYIGKGPERGQLL